MPYGLLADITMIAHFAFLVFLLFGGFLAWIWRKAWYVHAATAAYALFHITSGTDCPLTPLEDELRSRADQEGVDPSGFIATYIEGAVYPGELTTEVRWTAAFIIAVSWAGLLLLIRRDRRRARLAEHAV